MRPKISVVIPSYNHARYLAEALFSLANQSFRDFEVIVVDDGSSDHSLQVVQDWSSSMPIRVVRLSHSGVVVARNVGVSLAVGEYICFLDSDDAVMHGRFQQQAGLLTSYPDVCMVYGNVCLIDEYGHSLGHFHDDMVRPVQWPTAVDLCRLGCFIPIQGVMARTEVLRRSGPFDGPGPVCDYIKWVDMSLLGGILYDPGMVSCWRRHPGSTSAKMSWLRSYRLIAQAQRHILRKHPELRSRVGYNVYWARFVPRIKGVMNGC